MSDSGWTARIKREAERGTAAAAIALALKLLGIGADAAIPPPAAQLQVAEMCSRVAAVKASGHGEGKPKQEPDCETFA
jgi:hypothetical protein